MTTAERDEFFILSRPNVVVGVVVSNGIVAETAPYVRWMRGMASAKAIAKARAAGWRVEKPEE